MKSNTLRIMVLIALIISIMTPSSSAHATGILVNSILDTVAVDGWCTLREAIANSNSHYLLNPDCAGGTGADTITFSVSGTITLGSSLPTIYDYPLTINGTGQSVTIDGNHTVRIVQVSSVALTLVNLTIANGSADWGGGIYSNGSLKIINSTFTGNVSSNNGGAIYNSAGSLTITNSTFSGNNATLNGGAIMVNDGTVSITNSTFSGNSSTSSAGGGIATSSTTAITNSTFSNNSAAPSMGGGIFVGGNTTTLRNTILANSTGGNCDIAGGATLTNGGNNIDDLTSCGFGSANGSKSSTNPLLGTLANNGGPTQTLALLTGSPAIDGVTYSAPNSAPATDQRGVARPQRLRYDIGAYEDDPEIVVDSTADTIDDDGMCTLREAIVNANNNTATFTNCAAGSGSDKITFAFSGTILLTSTLPAINDPAGLMIDGGLHAVTISGNNSNRVLVVNPSVPLTLKHVTIANGYTTGSGGGVNNSGNLTVIDSTFSGNTTYGSSTAGGGIFNNSSANLTISGSTFSGNQSAGADTLGGGVFITGGNNSITNSTFSGNSSDAFGGAISCAGGTTTLTITNSTLSSNNAFYNQFTTNDGGGGITNSSCNITLRNTILANNANGGNCQINVPFAPEGNNIDDGTTCGLSGANGSMSSTDPLLDTLADNGGFTQTFALLAGSPAFNAGSDATCDAAPVNGLDQRGIVRPQGAHCDIGAYERRPSDFIYSVYLPLVKR